MMFVIESGAHSKRSEPFTLVEEEWLFAQELLKERERPAVRKVSLAVRIADCNIHCRLLAFDLCLDSAGNPRVIELNVGMFSWWLFLFIAQDVFAGKTQAVIDYCLEKEKQFHPHLRLM